MKIFKNKSNLLKIGSTPHIDISGYTKSNKNISKKTYKFIIYALKYLDNNEIRISHDLLSIEIDLSKFKSSRNSGQSQKVTTQPCLKLEITIYKYGFSIWNGNTYSKFIDNKIFNKLEKHFIKRCNSNNIENFDKIFKLISKNSGFSRVDNLEKLLKSDK
jgi:hypothetical protein